MARVLVFANPIAGRGKAKALALVLVRTLNQSGYQAEAVFDKPSSLSDEEIAGAGAGAGGTEAAIAIGGDGTIRGVAARLYAAAEKNPIPILIVPMGTANLLGRHLAIRWDDATLAEDVARALSRHRIVELDAATANGELFLLMAGIGLDAQVVHELDRVRHAGGGGTIDYTSYVLPAALALAKYRFPKLTVTVDQKAIAKKLAAVAFVGNVPEYGTGFPILPHAVADDGLLDVCVLPCANPKDLVLHAMRAVAGEHLAAEGSIYVKGKHVRVEADILAQGGKREEAPVQLDGDAAGYTPVEIELLERKVRFIVPER